MKFEEDAYRSTTRTELVSINQRLVSGEQSVFVSSSASQEWMTPPWLVDCVVDALDGISLDPVAHPSHNIPALQHMTKEDNSLRLPWNGKVYMNPPYGYQVGGFVRKLWDELSSGRVEEAITLVSVRTDAAWFQKMWDMDVLFFLQGRVKFVDERGYPIPGTTFASVLGYVGNRPQKFADAFKGRGRAVMAAGTDNMLREISSYTDGC